MIDHAALAAYPFRTADFDLGGDAYHLRGRTDGGVTLIQNLNVMFSGAVFKAVSGWVIEWANEDESPTFYSRDAAIYALLARVGERNAEYRHNIAKFDRGPREEPHAS
jgi:hypothetical protein